MMKSPLLSTNHSQYQWDVKGMDCASCAGKIEHALGRLEGVSDIQVSVMSGKLSLTLDATCNSTRQIEDSLSSLGFQASLYEQGQKDIPQNIQRSWLSHPKAKQVVLTGTLLLLAWLASFILSESAAQWGFISACLVALAPIGKKALSLLRAGMPFTIEMLMTIAALGALFIGAEQEAALVVFLFTLGELLEGIAANRARASIQALSNLAPKTALKLNDQATPIPIDADKLCIGDLILVRPGDRLPADGNIAEGGTSIDESPITGESVPVYKSTGEAVFAGTIVLDSAIKVTVTRAPEDNTIARIIKRVEEAQAAKAPTERFIQRFSRWYMPAIVLTALLVGVIPPLFFAQEWSLWIYRALALLLIGCPCALVISVPASIASALSAGARHGLLIKGGATLENMANTTVVAFDKTGTLTEGQPHVIDCLAINTSKASLIAIATGLEYGSSHPLAMALQRYATQESITPQPVNAVSVVPGLGINGNISGATFYLGSPKFAAEKVTIAADLLTQIETWEAQGKTVITLFSNIEILGLISLQDSPRADAASAIKQLKSLGIQPLMLTGDNTRTAKAIASELGLDCRASLLPEDKVSIVKNLSGTQNVMMVGDGINDAPALAAAQTGVAMGSGTDVALETADAALLKNRVTDIPEQIRLSKATMRNIRQNISLALGLKAVFLVTSILGITGLWLAILADTGATVLVTLNALRLLRYKPDDS